MGRNRDQSRGRFVSQVARGGTQSLGWGTSARESGFHCGPHVGVSGHSDCSLAYGILLGQSGGAICFLRGLYELPLKALPIEILGCSELSASMEDSGRPVFMETPTADVSAQQSDPALHLPPDRTVGDTPTFGSISVTQHPTASGSLVWPPFSHDMLDEV